MRILPVSSGKGGVGKTTFALNLALTLAKTQSTVLIDLDTGTSSLRHFLDAPVEKDLFHFFKRGSSLQECRQELPLRLDPGRAFSKFSFIASPRGFVHDIVNFDAVAKNRLVQGVNSLQAEYVIIDLKAGLDVQVLDFLPISNSGIILFTPGMRAATLAAAEIAKAILFRMLNIMISAPLVQQRYFSGPERPLALFQRLRDILQSGLDADGRNLDDFINEAAEQHPQDTFIRVLRYYVENFKVYYVLNRFNSVAESIESTIKPLLENIFRTVSGRVGLRNLGWLVEDEEIRHAGETGVPYLVRRHYRKNEAPPPAALASDDFLRQLCGLAAKKAAGPMPPTLNDELGNQIDLLRSIYVRNAGNDPETNLDFIAAAIREYSANCNHQFGMKHIFSEAEFLKRFQARLDG